MTAVPADFIAILEAIKRDLRKSGGKQVFSEKLKGKIRGSVEAYFRILKPAAAERGVKTSAELDATLQDLRALTHKNAATTSYLAVIDNAKKGLIVLDGELTGVSSIGIAKKLFDASDDEIVATLEKIVPSAAASYKQALSDLEDEDRYSYRGPATDLRECLRETLDHLAPDNDVKTMPGFKANTESPAPTMKQKVRYILINRGKSKSQIEPSEAAAEIVDEIIGKFVRAVYSRSNVSTHTPTHRDEVLRSRHFVRLALIEILEIRT